MKKSNSRAANPQAKIQCVEILVSKKSINANSQNLYWTLSIYSLENRPVKKNLDLRDSEIFHFMVYDWTRTIKQLLDEHQVLYSIIQFFIPETLFPETPGRYSLSDDENNFVAALQKLEGLIDAKAHSDTGVNLLEHSQEENANLILDEKHF